MSQVAALRPPDADLDPHGITARSGSNFLAGFVCLDKERREAMTVVYAFCRVVDDAVDDAPDLETGRTWLRFWSDELEAAAEGRATVPVGVALQASMQRFGIPVQALRELVAGCAMDLEPGGPADEAELELYCYRVAAAVGLACLPVLGADSEGGRRFANELGHALQLTNVLRDLRSDAEIDRFYVPQTWLDEFGIDRDILLGTAAAEQYGPDSGVAKLCDRLATRARQRFEAARRELRQLPCKERRGLVAARIMGAVYGDLLRRLVRRGGDIVVPRIKVPKWRKMWLALSVWAGVRA